MRMRTSLRCLAGLGILAASGCGLVLGLDDFKDAAPAGGATSAGSGGGATCEPEREVECYSGPPGTEDVGICRAGKQACKEDGSGYEACAGEVTPAKETCASADDEDCDGKDCVAWARLIGGAEEETVNGIAVDAVGNVYVAGSFSGAISLGENVLIASGKSDAFLVKLSPSGEFVWSRQLGGIRDESVYSLSVGPDGHPIVATIEIGSNPVFLDLVLHRYDPDGELSWRRALGGGFCGIVPTVVKSMAFAPDGDVVVVGDYCGDVRFDDNHIVSNATDLADVFVAKMRSSDGLIDASTGWVNAFGGEDSQYAHDVAVDSAGNVIVVGHFYDGLSIGDASFVSSGGSDVFLSKLTSRGLVSWARAFGGAEDDSVDSVAVDRLGGPVVLATFRGAFDVGGGELVANTFARTVFKYTTANAYRWHRIFDMDGMDVGSLSVEPQGGLLAVGGLTGDVELDGKVLRPGSAKDLLLLGMSDDAKLLWARAFSEVGDYSVASLARRGAQELLVAGRASSGIDLGEGVMSPEGESDIWVAKFQP
ncbi:SBBP repeat-containing protein [Sorangium sp. So ce296]|uniref:SBBP repeat-containing protein n=1 Tax=Sorangium sp. So ce296 TaxID=3133296 RepID=UPI003F6325D7